MASPDGVVSLFESIIRDQLSEVETIDPPLRGGAASRAFAFALGASEALGRLGLVPPGVLAERLKRLAAELSRYAAVEQVDLQMRTSTKATSTQPLPDSDDRD